MRYDDCEFGRVLDEATGAAFVTYWNDLENHEELEVTTTISRPVFVPGTPPPPNSPPASASQM
jgi:hypothetical protein